MLHSSLYVVGIVWLAGARFALFVQPASVFEIERRIVVDVIGLYGKDEYVLLSEISLVSDSDIIVARMNVMHCLV